MNNYRDAIDFMFKIKDLALVLRQQARLEAYLPNPHRPFEIDLAFLEPDWHAIEELPKRKLIPPK